MTLDSLADGQRAQGFVARAVYVDDAGRPRGARFVHERTRFVLDMLTIESAPQAYVYATTYPSSDGGAPHTQEHLLLGKGNKGRYLGNYDHVMLAQWSAGTWQYRTGYHFHTSAGTEAFWGILRTQLDALLHPDYSDEEILREVRNFGVARRPDGSLELDEKGTVYNEMVRTYEQPSTLAWDVLGRLVYGADHPLALSSGGTPEGIRALTPADIRRFHEEHYQLANMGMVAALPSSVPLPTALARVGETLDALAPQAPDTRHYLAEGELPAAHGAPAAALRVVDYPYATADQPGGAMLAWPAIRRPSPADAVLLDMFLAAFAGGEGSTLYAALVDRATRTLDVGATGVWGYHAYDPGHPVYVGVESVSPAHCDEASLRAVRELVLAKLRAIAAMPDGSSELLALNDRVSARIVEAQRAFDKVLDTPPGFGDRGASDFWIRQLVDLNRAPGFRKTLTQKEDFEAAARVAASYANAWRDHIGRWGLLEEPYGVVTRASPTLRKALDDERAGRVAAELARLQAGYGGVDAQEALRRREAEIARATASIAKAEAEVPMPPFVSDPPMTLDDSLAWRQTNVRGVPVVVSTFDAMKSATVGLALRVDGVAEEDLPYLALLPDLLRDVGAVRDGTPIAYDAMNDRLRREILDLGVGFTASFATGRAELSIVGSGESVDEARRALGWMHDVLTHPDWRPQNLPRIRDVVGRAATRLREVMTGPEEYWATSAAEAYRRQDSALLAHTASFLTRADDALRLSWWLEGADAETARRIEALGAHGTDGAHANREALGARAQELAKSPEAPLARAGRELAQLLADLPDRSLGTDWAALTHAMGAGAARDPEVALAGLRRVLAAVAHAGNARAWVVGSTRSQEALAADVDRLLGALDPSPPPRPAHVARDRVTERARARGAVVGDARVAGLVNPSTANGSLVDSAPTADYDEARERALVDFLAANVFSGTGTHSFYKRIWGAALAYSGYVAVQARTGRMRLYSDRCADLPQLVRFVDGEVRAATSDARFVDYAVANAFGARTADTFESRGAAMAVDLAEGFPPERIRAFRERLLALRAKPGLAEAIHARLRPVYATVIPTLDPASAVPAGADWFVIGPEAQLARVDDELCAARGPEATLLRLYPRDFWDVR